MSIIDDDTAEQDALLRIVTAASGYLGDSTDLTIIDNDQPNLTLALNRSAISEAAGPGELLATITRDTATSEALLVDLTGSSPSSFETIGTSFIPANQTSVTIPLTPVDNDTVEGLRSVTLWARSFEATTGNLLTESPIIPLEINDDDGPALSISIAKKFLLEGNTASVVITRNIVDATALTLTLSHGGDSRVSLTPAITIPANQAFTSTILTLADNAQPDGTEDLEIIASATGYASGSASLTISDETLPELLISRLDAIPEVNTNETGTFSYRISNLGGQTTSNPIEIQPLAPFSDYQGWVNAYMIPAGQQGQSTESPGAGIPNLLSYGLGIDPIGGISPAQAEPGPVVLISPTTSELCFQLPNGGRPDLRYLVQTTTDLVTWDTIGIKEGTLPWSEGSVITEENVSPNLSIIKVAHDKGLDDDDQRFMRLIVQIIE